jgi:hypothetical protein
VHYATTTLKEPGLSQEEAASYQAEAKRLSGKLAAQEEELALAERVTEEAVQVKHDLTKAMKLVESHELARREARSSVLDFRPHC